MNRRQWNKLMLGSLAAMAMPKFGKAGMEEEGFAYPEKAAGVVLGLQSYSLRDRSLEDAIKAMKELGVRSCELWSGHLEPRRLKAAELSKWRLETPLDTFVNARSLFDKAGIRLSALSAGFRNHMSDEEIDRIFLMAKAMKLKTITSSATVDIMPRVDRFAQKHKIVVGLHNHDRFEDKNEFSNRDSFERGLKGVSKYMAINLDIGHFVAANEDPVDFIRQYHQRIVMLHVKDRNKNHGDVVPFGEGQTPIKEVLLLMKEKGYRFPANIEYEYDGRNTVEEIRRCLQYCKDILA